MSDPQKPAVRSAGEKFRAILSRAHAAGGKVWDGLAPTVGHGNSEVVSLMYTGRGHVLYGHGSEPGRDQPPGVAGADPRTKEADPPGKEGDRGGAEMEM